jgi:hypothetical protein
MAQTEAFLAYDHSIAESAFSCLPCTALHQLWHERVLNQALHDGWLECVYVFLCVCLSVCVCLCAGQHTSTQASLAQLPLVTT